MNPALDLPRVIVCGSWIEEQLYGEERPKT